MEEIGQRLTDLSWAGGLIDGEGCITAARGVRLEVQSTSRATIERLRELLGGKCYVESRKTAKGRTVFRWVLYGAEAQKVLQDLSPYLTEKKEQAALVIKFYSYPTKSAMRASILERLKRLKRTS